ncbi:hypothetical protein A3739_21605 [Oleiphilus sp. HI0067]|nr:hypothetical protein A3739_21605 [Oleiphilus sp. HI0067]
MLGNLFKSTSKVVTKQNLLVFLRPTILRDKASTRAVTEQKFDQLWQLNLETKVAQGEDEEELRAREKPTVESLYDGNSIR